MPSEAQVRAANLAVVRVFSTDEEALMGSGWGQSARCRGYQSALTDRGWSALAVLLVAGPISGGSRMPSMRLNIVLSRVSAVAGRDAALSQHRHEIQGILNRQSCLPIPACQVMLLNSSSDLWATSNAMPCAGKSTTSEIDLILVYSRLARSQFPLSNGCHSAIGEGRSIWACNLGRKETGVGRPSAEPL